MTRRILLCFLLLTATASAGPAEPTAVARDIDAFCKMESACVARQRQSLRYFLNLGVVYDASQPVMESCMRKGKAGHAIDWTIAEHCMREWSKGRPAMLPGAPGFKQPG
jgi:hypothetical protein